MRNTGLDELQAGIKIGRRNINNLRYADVKWSESCSVMPVLFSIPWTVYSPWNSPGQNIGVGSLSLLQGIFPTQGSNPGPLYCRRILYQLSHKGSPRYANDTTLMAEGKEELKSLLMRVKEESERASLKLNIKKTKIMASSPITSWQIKGEKVEVVTDFLFLGSEITADDDYSEIRRLLLLGRKAVTNLDKCVEKQRHYSANKGPYSQGYGLPSGHIRLWELDHKEGRAPKNWCLRTVLERTPESPLASKELKQVNLKGNQPWTLIGMTDAEAPVFWLPDANSWLIGKVPDAGKGRGQKEKRVSKDEMAGWNHRCNGHELGQTSGDGEGQGGLACCSPWGRKESDRTGRLNI